MSKSQQELKTKIKDLEDWETLMCVHSFLKGMLAEKALLQKKHALQNRTLKQRKGD